MLPVQTTTAQTALSSHYGDRSEAATDVVAQLFSQVRIETDLNGLIDEIRCRKDQADFEANRPGISCMILLAHAMELVKEAEIDVAVTADWAAVYRLYQSAITNIMDHLNQESIRIAGIDSIHSDFEPISFALQKTEGEGFFLVLEACPRFSQFSLLDIDRELAKAVAGCLKWTIFNGGMGLTVDDLSESWMMRGDELDALKEALETHGHLSNADLAEFFLDNNVYPFTEITDDPGYLEERIGYLKSILIHNCTSLFGELPQIHEIRRMLVGWRKSHRAIYLNPWIKFIKETIKVWKWLETSRLNDRKSALSFIDSTQSDIPLDYGHVIGFGFDWEESVVSEVYDDMAQAGENPNGIIRLTPFACSEIGERLSLLGKSRGLIRLAEIINADLGNPCNA